MSSIQGESFQEIIQRYNRELLKLQRKAAQEGRAAPVVPARPGNLEEDGIETEGNTEVFAEPQIVVPEVAEIAETDDFINYIPDSFGVPDEVICPAPEGEPDTDAGDHVPVPLPDSVPVPDDGKPEAPSGCSCLQPDVVPPEKPEDIIPPPDISRCEDRNALHSQTVGPNGPVLLQDGILHETLETFISSTHRSRPLHVKGWSAAGAFRCYRSMKAYTAADFLSEAGMSTPVRVRFSQAASNAGTPDTTRNIRGFATKFYTRQGNFDIVGNNIPVFFIRDAIRFPEVVAALSPSPVTNLADPEQLWNFVARTPEAIHMVTWYYSDVGTIRSYRRMRGCGINTFVWKNADGLRKYVKYHWLPMAGEQYVSREEAERMLVDPDALGRDLYETIAKGDPVEYELNVQMMDPGDVGKLSFDPLDDTKVWDEKLYPLMPVGKMTLDRNPENYEERVEKLAFSPANLVEGIELSDDKMLQGRSFIYWDSQRRRLGSNFRNIPVNRPKSGGWSPNSLVTSGEGVRACGDQLRAEIHNRDNFTQAGERYRGMNPTQKEHFVDNMASELYKINGMTQSCVIGYLYQADPELGTRTQRMIESYMKRR